MEAIYSLARQVLAYLGEQESQSQKMPVIFTRILSGIDRLQAMRTINGANIVGNKIRTEHFESLGRPSEDNLIGYVSHRFSHARGLDGSG
jgi:hypothetical protein